MFLAATLIDFDKRDKRLDKKYRGKRITLTIREDGSVFDGEVELEGYTLEYARKHGATVDTFSEYNDPGYLKHVVEKMFND